MVLRKRRLTHDYIIDCTGISRRLFRFLQRHICTARKALATKMNHNTKFRPNDTVIFANSNLHAKRPDLYPPVGTHGIFKGRGVKLIKALFIEWTTGVTSCCYIGDLMGFEGRKR
jgi:hypothetical protein